MLPAKLPGQDGQVLYADLGSKGHHEYRAGGLAELREPTDAPGTEEDQKYHELEGAYEFPRGGKLAFFASLFQASLGCRLALPRMIRHTASCPQHPSRRCPGLTAEL